MKPLPHDQHPLAPYAAAIGIDWADKKHDIALISDPTSNHNVQAIEHRVIEATPRALTNWVATLQERFHGQRIAVAIEQRRGPLIHFLSAFDFIDIYPVPTLTLKNLRKALHPSGSKNDKIDCQLVLDVLTKHTDHLRLLEPESAEIRELAVLCEDRRRWVDQRTGMFQILRDACKNYFPVVLELFDFKSPIVCRFLQRWPTMEELRKVKPETLRRFFYANSCRGDVVERRISTIKQAIPLTEDPGVIRPLAMRVKVLSKQIIGLFEAIEPYDDRIEVIFAAMPSKATFRSLPGAGPTMAPRLAVAFGEDRSKYESAEAIQNYSGTSPVTKKSGKQEMQHFRFGAPTFMRQSFVEWANISRRSSGWAQAFYALRLEVGDSHNCALRKLAWKWQRIAYRLWQNEEEYEEAKYVASLRKHGSPVVAKMDELAAAA